MSEKKRKNAGRISLAHGGGGRQARDLIESVFLGKFDNSHLKTLDDAAVLGNAAKADKLAFTTDSYVINPLFFPGGDIGTLAVSGTVNDLVVTGAGPEYFSCSFIIEEGLALNELEKIVDSMSKACDECGIKIVTGDTKVVEKGACDKLFINTAGIGRVIKGYNLGVSKIKPADKVIITGTIGDHGITILNERNKFGIRHKIKSDCAPLCGLLEALSSFKSDIRFMRDPTRGGLSAVLNEIVAAKKSVGICLDEIKIPIKKDVKALSEILGLDPINIANEGKAVIFASAYAAGKIVKSLKKCPAFRSAAIIGEVTGSHKGSVYMRTKLGGLRLIDMPHSEQLPRIC
jgi:hydrogenase expression/formation protein HypE